MAALVATPALAQSSSGTAQQRILINPPPELLTPAPAEGLVRADGSLIAPADVNGRLPPPPAKGAVNNAPPQDDGILRSAPPSVAVDANGRGAVVSGATIR